MKILKHVHEHLWHLLNASCRCCTITSFQVNKTNFIKKKKILRFCIWVGVQETTIGLRDAMDLCRQAPYSHSGPSRWAELPAREFLNMTLPYQGYISRGCIVPALRRLVFSGVVYIFNHCCFTRFRLSVNWIGSISIVVNRGRGS